MRNTRIIEEIHEAWAVEHGYREKVQAASGKPEDLHAENTDRFVKAASRKRQASSLKLRKFSESQANR